MGRFLKQIGLIVAISVSALSFVPTANTNALTMPQTQFAATCGERVLTFPLWHNGLNKDDRCTVQITRLTEVWVIVLNVIEIMIQLGGYVAAGFIIWGSIKYIKSQGESSQINESKGTILNAVIGLFIVLTSVAIVNYISGIIR